MNYYTDKYDKIIDYLMEAFFDCFHGELGDMVREDTTSFDAVMFRQLATEILDDECGR